MEPKQAQQYDLTQEEIAFMVQLNQLALQAKSRIFDLQVLLEQARGALTGAQQQFTGAVTMIANVHGMSDAELTPDFKSVVARKVSQ